MKIKYFADTDTLYIEFRDAPIIETRDLDENTLLDVYEGLEGNAALVFALLEGCEVLSVFR